MENNKLETISNLFEGKEIRSIWDSEKEEYYFSVVDIIGALTDSNNPRKYWSVLKIRLKREGSELTTNCSQLKLKSTDGKYYNQDVLDTKGILRLIALTDLGEIATRELVKEHKPYGLKENREIARRGGKIAKNTRENLEKELGRKVITSKNALNYKYLDDGKSKKKLTENNE